jgi:glutamate racemase
MTVALSSDGNHSAAMAQRHLPIGVFDSGVGGLTVLHALREALPQESFVYLGDTARLPYGTKSPESVVRYATQCAATLVARGIKALVIACNTAASAALPALQARYPLLPIVGVIEPGAEAALAVTRSMRIAVIATEGTVQAGAYRHAIARLNVNAQVTETACQVFVALAEEGWTQGPIVELIIRQYLDGLFSTAQAPDTLLLGCTHFPVLRSALRTVLPENVVIVDSAQTTALAVAKRLQSEGLLCDELNRHGSVHFLATDGAARFARVGSIFLGMPLETSEVDIIDV